MVPFGHGGGEASEGAGAQTFGEVDDGQPIAEIGTIRAIAGHGFAIRHSRKGSREINLSQGEHPHRQFFHNLVDEFFIDEGCHILELSNSAHDPALSIARARVAGTPSGRSTP